MTGDRGEEPAGPRRDQLTHSERVVRSLTFWFRPAFVLKVLTRFEHMAGFDRAIALASSALTALIPIVILLGSILPHSDDTTIANQIISRYRLTGPGAEAVRDALAPATGTTTSINVLGAILLIAASLSFSRGVQRLFEQAWDLKPLSVRNSMNDLFWLAAVVAYLGFSWWIHHLIDIGRIEVAANLVVMPATALLLAWSGRILSAGRIGWRALLPFAVIGALADAAMLSVAGVYVPRLFSSYAARYGVIGAVLAMVSALFIVMIVVVATAATGREVADELERLRRGERPPDDEIRQEWHALIKEARSRTEVWRLRAGETRKTVMRWIGREPRS
jgi:membrane protein